MGMIALEYVKLASVPVALTTHQLPWFVASYLPAFLKPAVERVLWKYACSLLGKYTSLVSPTQTIAKIIEKETGIKPCVISYGLDIHNFYPSPSLGTKAAIRTKLGLPLNTPLLLHVGRLDADKSVDKAIRGAAQAIRDSEANLLIVGDGCQKDQIRRLCKDLNIERRVHFTGYVAPADLPDIYRAADLFITASEIETQGIVLLEAAASGLPIVAVNATCIPEIVHDQVNGCLVEPGHIKAFGNAVDVLLNDPQKSYSMGMNGRAIAQVHGIQTTWMLYENLYKEMQWKIFRQKIRSISDRSMAREFFKT
jgi:glycosyltransferase involved in cell wall biosynthesis